MSKDRAGVQVEAIEADADAEAERTGRQPRGAEAIRRQEPTTLPNQIKNAGPAL